MGNFETRLTDGELHYYSDGVEVTREAYQTAISAEAGAAAQPTVVQYAVHLNGRIEVTGNGKS